MQIHILVLRPFRLFFSSQYFKLYPLSFYSTVRTCVLFIVFEDNNLLTLFLIALCLVARSAAPFSLHSRHTTPPHHVTSHHTTPHHTTSHNTTSHHTTPRHTTPHHVTQHHTTSHNTTPHHVTPHHTTPHHTTPLDRIVIENIT